MTEDFLHYLWRYYLLTGDLKLINGDKLVIINSGLYNMDAGPDFFNAKIKINDTVWAGNIEIHLNASDWLSHNHEKDASYDNIILHVVYNNDLEIKRKNAEIIPQLEVRNKFDIKLLEKYNYFLQNKNWIPCENLIKRVDSFTLNNWIERILIERIERKTTELKNLFELNKNNWEETFYQLLAKNFGFNLNATPFELLSKSLPISILAKHKNNEFQISALLFGQAGMLNSDCRDDYPLSLYAEYDYLKKKYKLKAIRPHLWKFLRLRPANFPTIRISQFANLINKSSHIFSKIIESKTIEEINHMFDIKSSEYFDNHYFFDSVLSNEQPKIMGKSAIDLIIINAIVPMLFLYASEKDDKQFQTIAISYLEKIKAENNSIITKWKSTGMKVKNAAESQGYLELKNNYCTFKKCLQCAIGNHLLRKTAINQ